MCNCLEISPCSELFCVHFFNAAIEIIKLIDHFMLRHVFVKCHDMFEGGSIPRAWDGMGAKSGRGPT